jgi:hypothetical protein
MPFSIWTIISVFVLKGRKKTTIKLNQDRRCLAEILLTSRIQKLLGLLDLVFFFFPFLLFLQLLSTFSVTNQISLNYSLHNYFILLKPSPFLTSFLLICLPFSRASDPCVSSNYPQFHGYFFVKPLL